MLNTTKLNCFHLNPLDITSLPEYLSFIYIVNCVIYSSFAVLTIVGNCAILVAMIRNPSLHTPGNVLIACLALSDLAVGLLVQPSYIPYKVAELRKHFITFCQLRLLYNLSGFLFSVLSCLIVTIISIDRFFAPYLHLRYNEIVTVRRVIYSVLVCLTFSLTLTFLLVWYSTMFLVGAIVIIICLLLTFSSNCCLLKWITHHHRQITNFEFSMQHQQDTGDNTTTQQSQQEAKFRKSVFTITCVVGLMFMCYLPYFAVFVYRTVIGYPTYQVRFGHNLTEMIAFLNSAFNPFLYCWNIGEIRQAVLKTLRCR